MGRKPRIEYDGTIHINRGINRGTVRAPSKGRII
jgi:hypothetical protein